MKEKRNSLGTPAAYRSTKCEERSEPEGRLFSFEMSEKAINASIEAARAVEDVAAYIQKFTELMQSFSEDISTIREGFNRSKDA
ncbi:MAG: hypothetical protein U5P10_11835 [Spirochaetia bacterium]|nr:hypothetical protein [Spirochaetia bacterium]